MVLPACAIQRLGSPVSLVHHQEYRMLGLSSLSSAQSRLVLRWVAEASNRFAGALRGSPCCRRCALERSRGVAKAVHAEHKAVRAIAKGNMFTCSLIAGKHFTANVLLLYVYLSQAQCSCELWRLAPCIAGRGKRMHYGNPNRKRRSQFQVTVTCQTQRSTP